MGCDLTRLYIFMYLKSIPNYSLILSGKLDKTMIFKQSIYWKCALNPIIHKIQIEYVVECTIQETIHNPLQSDTS